MAARRSLIERSSRLSQVENKELEDGWPESFFYQLLFQLRRHLVTSMRQARLRVDLNVHGHTNKWLDILFCCASFSPQDAQRLYLRTRCGGALPRAAFVLKSYDVPAKTCWRTLRGAGVMHCVSNFATKFAEYSSRTFLMHFCTPNLRRSILSCVNALHVLLAFLPVLLSVLKNKTGPRMQITLRKPKKITRGNISRYRPGLAIKPTAQTMFFSLLKLYFACSTCCYKATIFNLELDTCASRAISS